MQKGFTLIELLVIIAIISLLMSVTLLSINAAKHPQKAIEQVKVIQTVPVTKGK